MKRNRVGRSRVEVTSFGLGTAQLGDLYQELDQAAATAIVDAAWDCGVRYFDTAPHYGLGLAERRLGVALADRPRDEYVVSTKVGRLLVADGAGGLERRWDFSGSGIERSIEESLERLGLDRVDIALIHDPQGVGLTESLAGFATLERLRSDGVVGAIGVGSGDLPALLAFARNTDIDVAMVAGRLTLLEQPALAELVPECEARGISIFGAGIFNSGLLASDHPSTDARYEYAPAPAELLARARRLGELAREHGTTLPQAALKYAALNPVVASIVVGADSAEQVRNNVRMFEEDIPLDSLWRVLPPPDRAR